VTIVRYTNIIYRYVFIREDAQNRLIDMSDEDKQQIALHKAEVKELQRQYDRDLKLQDFLSIKGTHAYISINNIICAPE